MDVDVGAEQKIVDHGLDHAHAGPSPVPWIARPVIAVAVVPKVGAKSQRRHASGVFAARDPQQHLVAVVINAIQVADGVIRPHVGADRRAGVDSRGIGLDGL